MNSNASRRQPDELISPAQRLGAEAPNTRDASVVLDVVLVDQIAQALELRGLPGDPDRDDAIEQLHRIRNTLMRQPTGHLALDAIEIRPALGVVMEYLTRTQRSSVGTRRARELRRETTPGVVSEILNRADADPRDSIRRPQQGRDEGQLFDRLSDPESADHAFELLSTSLAGHALPCLLAWIASGRIYRECASYGFPLSPTVAEREHLLLHGEEAEDLVIETVARALTWLRRQALSGEMKWDHEGGASLATYFLGACVRNFPVPWRSWSREFRRRPVPTSSESVIWNELIDPDNTESHVTAEADIRDRLSRMPTEVRTMVELRLEGLTHAQIAQRLGLSDARAVDRRMTRLRQELRTRSTR